ncbi:MAG: hypothetical protein ACT4QC_02325 [Planctomycetaceae bacterium]
MATDALIEGFEFLVWQQYRWLEHNRNLWLRDRADEVLGQLFIDLCEAVEWLGTNTVPASGIKAHIRANLYHSHRHDYREAVKYEHSTPGDGMTEPLLKRLSMMNFQRDRQREAMADALDSLRPDTPRDSEIVEALRDIAKGTRKLADCLELRGLRHDRLKLKLAE